MLCRGGNFSRVSGFWIKQNQFYTLEQAIVYCESADIIMANLTPDAAVNAVSEKLGLNTETNPRKQVAVYVTASIVLNGFLDIFTGTADVASLLSGINLQAFSLAQIKQMTEQINKNVTTLMEADGKAAWDHFKRGEFKEAHDRALKGFHAAPNKIESGIPIKLMCTRIKLMTELIREDEGSLFVERSNKTGLIIQTCLDELLDDLLVKELWERARSRINPIKSPSLELIAQMDDLVGGCYATMSHCLGWTFPDRILKDGEIAHINTKYLPLEKKYRITVPISQHFESFTSMEVFKEVDKILHLTITVTDNKKGVHQKYEITEKSVNPKPSKFSSWALKLKKNQYSLSKITDKDPTADDLTLENTEPDRDYHLPKHSNSSEPGRPTNNEHKEENDRIPGLMDLGSEATDMETKKKEEIKDIEDISGGNQTPEKKNNMIDEEDVEKIEKCKQEEGEIAKPKQIDKNLHEEITKEMENKEEIDEDGNNHYGSLESASEAVSEGTENCEEEKTREKQWKEAEQLNAKKAKILGMCPENILRKSDIFGIGISKEGSKILNVLEGIVRLDTSARNAGETKNEDLDDYELEFEEDETENHGGDTIPASGDIMLGALSSCDPVLLQDVFERMASCQLAVPIIMPNLVSNMAPEFKMWASRMIRKKWIDSQTTKATEKSVSNYPTLNIGFMRLGRTQTVSKSEIANNFLSVCHDGNRKISSFRTKEDQLTGVNANFTGGSLEAAWFLPDEESEMKELTCVLNLRGSAEQYKAQSQLMLQGASVSVIMFNNEEQLTGIFDQSSLDYSSSMKILVDFGRSGIKKKLKFGDTVGISIPGKDKNAKTIANEIIRATIFLLKQNKTQNKNSLDNLSSIARRLSIHVDEDDEIIKKAKMKSNAFLDMLKNKAKEDSVPLQGHQWMRYAEYDKEESKQLKIGNTEQEEYIGQMVMEKMECRKKQRQNGISKEMNCFIANLNSVKQQGRKGIAYFLKYCQIGMDEKSEEVMPELVNQYIETKNTIQKNQTKSLTTEEKKDAQKQLKENGDKLECSSFGIEHVFREMGQIYEAYHEYENYEKDATESDFSYLPHLMAEMMLDGQSLELLDGKVSHIPMKWVKDVLSELGKMIGKNSRVFVLDILGIQSSGKSTLLNTMFGCRFPVSSGRCTRGAYIQLIPVRPEHRERTKCDYFLILDSEGLRSPELSNDSGSFKHDNEIATLVTCLANLTIINIWGSTFSGDLSDIIQIVAHSYLRMKEVEIDSFFHILFAGVQDIKASTTNITQMDNVITKIQNEIERVASSENKTVQSLGDDGMFPQLDLAFKGRGGGQNNEGLMIGEKDIYFPQFLPTLWQNNMKEPDEKYGKIASQLTDSILQALESNVNKGSCSMVSMENQRKETSWFVGMVNKAITHQVSSTGQSSDKFAAQSLGLFIKKFQMLWKAIKKETYVFKFQNIQAVKAFEHIQGEYDKQVGEFRTQFHDLAKNILYTSFTRLHDHSEQEIFAEYQELHDKIDKLVEDQKEEMRVFIDSVINDMDQEDANFVTQYQTTFQQNFEMTVSSWLDEEKKSARSHITQTTGKKNEQITKNHQYKTEVLKSARECAKSAKGQGKDENLIISELFEEWQEDARLKDAKENRNAEKIRSEIYKNTEQEFRKILVNHFGLNHWEAVELEKKAPGLQTENLRTLTNKDFRWTMRRQWSQIVCDHNEKLRNVNKKIVEKIKRADEETIDGFMNDGNVLVTVEKVLEELKNVCNEEMELTKETRIEILCWTYVDKIISQGAKKYQVQFFRVDFLKSEKTNIFREFQEFYKNDSHDIWIGEKFCDVICKNIIQRKILAKAGQAIYSEALGIEQFGTKKHMIHHMLKEFAEQDAGEKIIHFACSFEECLKVWIQEKLIQKITRNGSGKTIEDIGSIAKESIKSSVISSAKENGEPKAFWDELLKTLNEKEFFLNSAEQLQMKEFADENVLDLDLVTETIIETLKQGKGLDNHLHEMDSNEFLDSLEFKVVDEIVNVKNGCTHQCYFCGAVCSNSNKLHPQSRHSSEIHMPGGLSGWRYQDSQKLVPEICTSLAAQPNRGYHLSSRIRNDFPELAEKYDKDKILHYRDLKKDITTWKIEADSDSDTAVFWKWGFVHYQDKIVEYHSKTSAVFPSDSTPGYWKEIDKSRAIEDLESFI